MQCLSEKTQFSGGPVFTGRVSGDMPANTQTDKQTCTVSIILRSPVSGRVAINVLQFCSSYLIRVFSARSRLRAFQEDRNQTNL